MPAISARSVTPLAPPSDGAMLATTRASGRLPRRAARRLPLRQRGAAGIRGRRPQVSLDPQQLVVLGQPLGLGDRADLDLAAARADREVGHERVLGLARAG